MTKLIEKLKRAEELKAEKLLSIANECMTKKQFYTFPNGALPRAGTKAYSYLMMLISDDVVLEHDLMLTFDGQQRGPLQQLSGDHYLHWLIHPVRNDERKIIGRQLDVRHLSGDWELDAEARRERRHMLKADSYYQAKLESERLPKAREEYQEAVKIRKQKGSEQKF